MLTIPNDIKNRILYNEPLSLHTTLKIGGPAENFIKLDNLYDLPSIINHINQRKLNLTVLGSGSNVLINDTGLNGFVIILPQNIRITNECQHEIYLNIEAGCLLSKIIKFTKSYNYGGLEFLIGIPGTIGGSIVMNAGAQGHEISEYVDSVSAINIYTGEISKLLANDCKFNYRDSFFRSNSKWLITNVTLKIPKTQFQENCYKEFRLRTQPQKQPNAGSVFKNPKNQSAGFLIEKYVGKGYQLGNAAISKEHANIFVNLGNATATDFLALINHTKKIVRENTGIELDLEIIIL